MEITFWGVRGSFPAAAPHCVRFGGNTPCVEVDTGQTSIIIDAGTGIRALGDALIEGGVDEIHLLFSHTHWDHIQGLPYFAPLYEKRTRIHIYGPKHPRQSLHDILRGQQSPPYFPIPFDDVPATLEFTELEDGQQFTIGDTRIHCRRLNHPGVACGYRFENDGGVFAYICDAALHARLPLGDGMDTGSEQEQREWLDHLNKGARDLAHRSDLLVCDTFFLPEDYKPDWGHSRPDDALRLGLEEKVKRVVFFHHDPQRSDAQLETILKRYQGKTSGQLELLTAAEGMQLSL